MNNLIRERVKENFPTVLLTLLSIVQAIALELLWGHVVEATHLYTLSFEAIVGWLQVAATLMGFALIWVVYASNVMRFRWVPTIADSMYPFIVGIVEFWLVETMGPNSLGIWFLVLGVVIAVMTYVSQITMRRARYDNDNHPFFEGREPATIVDFIPQIMIVLTFVTVGLLVMFQVLPAWLDGLGVGLSLVFLVWQFYSTSVFWAFSVRDVEVPE